MAEGLEPVMDGRAEEEAVLTGELVPEVGVGQWSACSVAEGTLHTRQHAAQQRPLRSGATARAQFLCRVVAQFSCGWGSSL